MDTERRKLNVKRCGSTVKAVLRWQSRKNDGCRGNMADSRKKSGNRGNVTLVGTIIAEIRKISRLDGYRGIMTAMVGVWGYDAKRTNHKITATGLVRRDTMPERANGQKQERQ